MSDHLRPDIRRMLIASACFGAVTGGWLDDRIGPKRLILACILILILASIGLLSVDANHVGFVIPVAPPEANDGLFTSVGEKIYLVLGGVIGAVAGPVQASGRTLLVRVSPREHMTQFFGLYALSGKITSFIGPLAVGALTAISGSQRIGISIILVFLIAGMTLLTTVKPHR